MPIIKTPNQSFRWLFAELVVVVLGVLIALAASSWYEDTQRRLEELEILGQFTETLKEEVSRLKNRLADLSNDKGEIVELLANIETSTTYLPKSSNGIDALKSYWPQQFDFAIYEVLKSKGFDLISNEIIRLRIIDFYEIAYSAVSDMMESERLYVRDQVDYLVNTEFMASNEEVLYWTPRDYDSIRSNVEFRNLAILKVRRLEAYENGAQRAIDWGEEILAMIEQEI
jgi:type II secretory pathway pseudopilin PulG